MAHRGTENAFGDLAERRARMDGKYSADLEKEHVEWIESVTGEKIEGSFQEWLKSGLVLCRLMNKLAPGSVKSPYTGGIAFKQMENISKFLASLPAYGIEPESVFQSADLYEGVNMTAVQVCIERVKTVTKMKADGKEVKAQPAKRGVFRVPEAKKDFKKEVKLASGPSYSSSEGKDGAFGDLAERKARMEAKYDKELEASLKQWIESTSGEAIGDDFQEGLKSGVILCKLANAIKADSIPSINSSSMAFKQMENITKFVDFCKSQGVATADLFQTVDLYEAGNMTQVLSTLDNLRRLSK